MTGGFYLMHRGWMDGPLFIGEKFTRAQAWEWLIHEASFEPHQIKHPTRMEMISVRRGQVPTSYRALKDKWLWSNDRVRAFLDLLESEWMLVRETGHGFLIITICNYDKYQISKKQAIEATGTHTGTPIGTSIGTDSGTQIGTPYIEKEAKEIKETTPPSTGASAKEIFDWLERFFNSPNPYIMAPVFAWLEWGADFEKDIKPAAERFMKRKKGAPGSLTWLDEDITRSIQHRSRTRPEVKDSARSTAGGAELILRTSTVEQKQRQNDILQRYQGGTA